ncbi:hypothetical protein [Roseateles sp. L2-2]|uniref:hypothetical protein n=1 Tax=Roseateles sp. L2-2 TaxID=3422597 RepID=UPI003D3625F5
MTVAHWEPAGRGRRRIAGTAALLVQGTAVVLLWLGYGKAFLDVGTRPRSIEIALVTALPKEIEDRSIVVDPPAPWTPFQRRDYRPAPIFVAPPEVTITAAPPSTSLQTVAAPAQPASGASAPLGNGRTTLNLALPKPVPASDARVRMADQIRNDDRSHSAPRTVESAIADAAGTLPIVTAVSTSGSGSKVIRQGSKCTRVYENRVAALNPTDDRLKDAPAMVGNCFSK